MNIFLEKNRKCLAVVQFVMMMIWVSQLIYTDSYFSVYALCSGLGVVCLYDNYLHNRIMTKMSLFLGMTVSVLLSLAVTLANYPVFSRIRNLKEISMGTNSFLNVLELALSLVCGVIVFYQIFQCLAGRFPVTCGNEGNLLSGKHPARVFWGSFLCFASIYLIYLFFVVYPGSFTSDTIWQLCEIQRDSYTTMHPFWHTMALKWLMFVGYSLFGNANAAAATFSAVQSLYLAAVFAYAVVTLYQHRIPRHWIILTFLSFACLPNHITYSCTAWKDVPFGVSMLLLTIAMFRVIRGVGKYRKLNYVMLMLGGIIGCMMRSNAGTAIAAALLFLGIIFRKRCKDLWIPCLIMFVAVYILTGPALDYCQVKNNNDTEALSVPLQQVARVIYKGYELTEEETALLDTILDIEKVPEEYTQHCVDPIKVLIRAKNEPYFLENKSQFLKLWIDIGLRYPWEYVEAWVEETKGYWNGGYDYYIYAQYVSDNDFGLYMVQQTNLIHKLVKAYFTLTRETVFFEPLQSIGFNVWVLFLLFFLNLLNKRKEWLLFVPVLALVIVMWLITPVFSEFRYAYSVFTTLPFLLPISLCRSSEETS